MIKKALFLLLLMFCIKQGNCQLPDYHFPLPAKWGVEKLSFPIDFAPNIPFSGTEELRFAPSWNNSKSDEYWTYVFLWFINDKLQLNPDALNFYLKQYYNGLYLSNLKDKTKPPSNFTVADVKSIHPLLNDEETYQGNITTPNFLTGQLITFNARIHVRSYPQVGHSAILFEISPQAYTQPVWVKMNNIIRAFSVNDFKDY
jgi:hypothetical protein